MEKPSVIVLAGPTAVGKTALSLKLAKALGGEIISADSMQVYKGMDIGTAKANGEERAMVPHHMLDVADPAENFSVADYVPLAEKALQDILSRGRIPIICGGTGFYIQALLKGLDFSEPRGDDRLRRELAERMEAEGALAFHRELARLDPEAAAAIHPHNKKRVIRALEYYLETGQPISALNKQQEKQESPYRVLYLVLNLPRQQLYERIDRRVEAMMQAGLVEEVRRLLAAGVPENATAMQGLGYKEVLTFMKDCVEIENIVARIKLGSRHYAKRQITWFKREKDAVWTQKEAYESEEALYGAVLALCNRFLNNEEVIL